VKKDTKNFRDYFLIVFDNEEMTQGTREKGEQSTMSSQNDNSKKNKNITKK